MITTLLSIFAKAFMMLLMLAAVFGMVSFFVIMCKGRGNGNGGGLPWL